MVSIFLFYSGFGIFESIKNKGISYVKTLLKKAVILFIKFQLSLLIFLLNNLFLGIKLPLKQYLLAIIFKCGIGNSFLVCFHNYILLLLFIYFF